MLRSMPIRKRLMSIMLLTSGCVLLLTCAGFLGYEALTFRKTLARQLSTTAAIVADNSTAVLAFADTAGAREILSAFGAEPNIRTAALYDAEGGLFATFVDSGAGELAAIPSRPAEDGVRFHAAALEVHRPVAEGGRRLGTLFVRSDLLAVRDRFRTYGAVAVSVAALAFLLAYLLSRLLQRQITEPLLALAGTARSVSERRDYSVRASKHDYGEIGALTDAFNQMLAQIQAQLGRMELLNRITRAVGERLDLPSVFQVMVRTLEDNLPMDLVCVCMWEPASGSFTVSGTGARTGALAADLGLSRGSRVPADRSVLAEALAGRVAYEPDITGSPHPFPMRLAAKGLRSLFLSPLAVEGKVIGLLLAARRGEDGFPPHDRDFLRQLAEHAALAAHQAHLYGALQKAYDDLRLSQQAVMQQERLRALGQLASGIAHDINNAISPVALYTESLLEREPGLSPRARENLQTIAHAIEDVAATVARMREFARQREPEMPLVPVSLNRALGQVIDLTRARWNDMAQQKGAVITIRTDLARDLPDILGVEGEVREAFTNLFLNAFDAMPDGGTLTLRTRRGKDGRVVAEVQDTGVGMSEETRRRCLEPFYTTKGERGTGLGLAMVYGVAERHGADLEIDSAPGRGTAIRLVFPASAAVAPEPPKAPQAPAVPSRLRILVVDDDPLVAKVLKDTLKIDGHDVATADGGQAGIDAFLAALRAGAPFDLVMTDLGMPYVDGGRVAAAVKEASSVTPVILLTGWGQRLIAEGEQPPGVDRLLSKPPKLVELREALASLAPGVDAKK